tara:strand:- start:83 stop:277 length:195 start_codon:yes stop_codon:yes gene_type:complete
MFVISLYSASFFQKDNFNQKKNYLPMPYLLTPNKNIKLDCNEEQLKFFINIINCGLVYIFGKLL